MILVGKHVSTPLIHMQSNGSKNVKRNTRHKKNRNKVKEFMSRDDSFVSLRCTSNPRIPGGWFWQAFQTGKDGEDLMVWDLGNRPFP